MRVTQWFGGNIAGRVNSKGYRIINFKGVRHRAHRIIWYLFHGYWPSTDIDHIDGNRDNNRIENLRDIGKSGNSQNIKRARVDNTTGFLGVSPYGKNGKFKSHICVKGQSIHIGVFSTALEAHQAYLQAKRKLHIGCTI